MDCFQTRMVNRPGFRRGFAQHNEGSDRTLDQGTSCPSLAQTLDNAAPNAWAAFLYAAKVEAIAGVSPTMRTCMPIGAHHACISHRYGRRNAAPPHAHCTHAHSEATLYISTFCHACTQAGRLYDADIHDCNMRETHFATQGASHAPCGEQTLVVQGFPAYTGACMWQPVCAREICASGAASERSERPGEARRG